MLSNPNPLLSGLLSNFETSLKQRKWENYSRTMEVMEIVSLVLIVTGIFTINVVTRLLYRSDLTFLPGVSRADVVPCDGRYHSSILYIKRNILTYLSLLLVTSINLISNVTVNFVPPRDIDLISS